MEYLRKLLSALGVWNSGVDIVGTLPVEISEMILQKLDPQSLLNASRVSRNWMAICKGSSRLRRSARHHLRKKQRQLIQNDGLQCKKVVTTSVTRVVRMQKDLAQRVSMKGNLQNPRELVCDKLRNTQLFCKNVPSKSYRGFPSKPSTRSLLRLR